jgi:hypothetical protein
MLPRPRRRPSASRSSGRYEELSRAASAELMKLWRERRESVERQLDCRACEVRHSQTGSRRLDAGGVGRFRSTWRGCARCVRQVRPGRRFAARWGLASVPLSEESSGRHRDAHKPITLAVRKSLIRGGRSGPDLPPHKLMYLDRVPCGIRALRQSVEQKPPSLCARRYVAPIIGLSHVRHAADAPDVFV